MLAVTQLTGWGGAGQDDASIGGGVYMSGVQLTRGVALTGSTVSKVCTFSMWFRRASWGNVEYVFAMDSEWIGMYIYSDDVLYFSTSADHVTNEIAMKTSISLPTDFLWHHIALSYNLSSGGTTASHLYLDGVSRKITDNSVFDATVDWRFTDFIIGTDYTTSTKPVIMSMAEFYLNTKEYVDLSVPANLAKFRTNAGKPAELGANGSRPTGNAPLVYQRHVQKASANDIATNRGTGGGLTRFGSPWEDPLWVSSPPPWKAVYGSVLTAEGGGDFAGWTTRQRIPAANITGKPTGQTQVRLILAAPPGNLISITKCYIGIQAGGDPWDASSLVQVTFNGGSPATGSIPAGGYLVSDPVNWTYVSGNVLVTMYFTAGANLAYGNAIGTQMYMKNADEAATLNVTGYDPASADLSYTVTAIEMV